MLQFCREGAVCYQECQAFMSKPMCQNQSTKGLIIWSGISVLAICVLIPNLNITYFFNLLTLAKTENCPFCYGKSMCQCVNGDSFQINWDHFWSNLLNLFISGKVFFGSCDDSLVVVKKFTKPEKYQDMGLSLMHIDNITIPQILNEVGQLLSKTRPKYLEQCINKFHFCPTFEKLGLLFELSAVNTSIKDNNLEELYLSFFHMVQVNVEPIIQQIAATNDWAVAEFLGSCGELTVSKYCGNTLTWAVPSLNWTQRSAIAKQLLLFAFNTTLQHPNFAFYFTDMTSDNFAVSSEGIVRLVDLEHVIVVDKYPRDEPNSWETNHECHHYASENGFEFDPNEICSHKISDVNIYAICLGILSENSDLLYNGLLHAPPQEVEGITRLVQDCVSPPLGQTRFQIAESIIQKLNNR